jgi:hypothetical protein
MSQYFTSTASFFAALSHSKSASAGTADVTCSEDMMDADQINDSKLNLKAII